VEAAEAKLLGNVGANDAFTRQLALASDAFIVQAPGGRSTIIAGYPWFSDWGRDTMIALPGLCLTTGRAEVAAEILRSFAAYVDRGMIPNRFPDVGERPEYNTVDATLWYVVAIYRYVESTGDVALLRETLWPALQEIVRCHREGTRYGIHMDPEDGLLYAGQPGVQLTWMDAKVGDWVVTPRIGKPVEINALWHSALAAMATFAERLGEDAAQAEYAALARTAATQFAARYTRLDGRGLYDVLDTPGGGPDMAIRPNQVFALSLPLAPLDPTSPLARAIVLTVQQELYTPCGLRTLSPRDPAYRPRYEGDPLNRDRAYHQGTVWPWLMGPYVEACYRVTGNRERAIGLLRPLMDELTAYGIGSLAEVYDGGTPQRPNGCIAQAWSVSETLRVWKQLQAVPEDAP
jgi:predicted glycogen debranching enzyme